MQFFHTGGVVHDSAAGEERHSELNGVVQGRQVRTQLVAFGLMTVFPPFFSETGDERREA